MRSQHSPEPAEPPDEEAKAQAWPIPRLAPPPSAMRIMVVFAHPDDESFGPAGVLAKYAQAGAVVTGLFFTRGQNGDTGQTPPPSPEELGRLRTQDLLDATRVIGFRDVTILEYLDGTLDQVPPERLEADVLAAFERERPNLVITFGPGGITHHPDHLAVYRATTSAFGRTLQRGPEAAELYYSAVPRDRAEEMNLVGLPDSEPNTFIEAATTFAIKIAALKFHARHVLDAQEYVTELEAHPRTEATLHRAWPEVPNGLVIRGFFEEPRDG